MFLFVYKLVVLTINYCMKKIKVINLLLCVIAPLWMMISSCQKDSSITDEVVKTNLTDSLSAFNSTGGNYLAATGTLKVKINDSVYTFDAAVDSIAFIKAINNDKNRYFGITAINKDHTMSFGISSSGFVYSHISSGIAGSQFLLIPDYKSKALQYSLSKFSGQKDFGNIKIETYNQDNELAKGTFFTFLATDDKANSPFYKVEGSFDLQLK